MVTISLLNDTELDIPSLDLRELCSPIQWLEPILTEFTSLVPFSLNQSSTRHGTSPLTPEIIFVDKLAIKIQAYLDLLSTIHQSVTKNPKLNTISSNKVSTTLLQLQKTLPFKDIDSILRYMMLRQLLITMAEKGMKSSLYLQCALYAIPILTTKGASYYLFRPLVQTTDIAAICQQIINLYRIISNNNFSALNQHFTPQMFYIYLQLVYRITIMPQTNIKIIQSLSPVTFHLTSCLCQTKMIFISSQQATYYLSQNITPPNNNLYYYYTQFGSINKFAHFTPLSHSLDSQSPSHSQFSDLVSFPSQSLPPQQQHHQPHLPQTQSYQPTTILLYILPSIVRLSAHISKMTEAEWTAPTNNFKTLFSPQFLFLLVSSLNLHIEPTPQQLSHELQLQKQSQGQIIIQSTRLPVTQPFHLSLQTFLLFYLITQNCLKQRFLQDFLTLQQYIPRILSLTFQKTIGLFKDDTICFDQFGSYSPHRVFTGHPFLVTSFSSASGLDNALSTSDIDMAMVTVDKTNTITCSNISIPPLPSPTLATSPPTPPFFITWLKTNPIITISPHFTTPIDPTALFHNSSSINEFLSPSTYPLLLTSGTDIIQGVHDYIPYYIQSSPQNNQNAGNTTIGAQGSLLTTSITMAQQLQQAIFPFSDYTYYTPLLETSININQTDETTAQNIPVTISNTMTIWSSPATRFTFTTAISNYLYTHPAAIPPFSPILQYFSSLSLPSNTPDGSHPQQLQHSHHSYDAYQLLLPAQNAFQTTFSLYFHQLWLITILLHFLQLLSTLSDVARIFVLQNFNIHIVLGELCTNIKVLSLTNCGFSTHFAPISSQDEVPLPNTPQNQHLAHPISSLILTPTLFTLHTYLARQIFDVYLNFLEPASAFDSTSSTAAASTSVTQANMNTTINQFDSGKLTSTQLAEVELLLMEPRHAMIKYRYVSYLASTLTSYGFYGIISELFMLLNLQHCEYCPMPHIRCYLPSNSLNPFEYDDIIPSLSPSSINSANVVNNIHNGANMQQNALSSSLSQKYVAHNASNNLVQQFSSFSQVNQTKIQRYIKQLDHYREQSLSFGSSLHTAYEDGNIVENENVDNVSTNLTENDNDDSDSDVIEADTPATAAAKVLSNFNNDTNEYDKSNVRQLQPQMPPPPTLLLPSVSNDNEPIHSTAFSTDVHFVSSICTQRDIFSTYNAIITACTSLRQSVRCNDDAGNETNIAQQLANFEEQLSTTLSPVDQVDHIERTTQIVAFYQSFNARFILFNYLLHSFFEKITLLSQVIDLLAYEQNSESLTQVAANYYNNLIEKQGKQQLELEKQKQISPLSSSTAFTKPPMLLDQIQLAQQHGEIVKELLSTTNFKEDILFYIETRHLLTESLFLVSLLDISTIQQSHYSTLFTSHILSPPVTSLVSPSQSVTALPSFLPSPSLSITAVTSPLPFEQSTPTAMYSHNSQWLFSYIIYHFPHAVYRFISSALSIDTSIVHNIINANSTPIQALLAQFHYFLTALPPTQSTPCFPFDNLTMGLYYSLTSQEREEVDQNNPINKHLTITMEQLLRYATQLTYKQFNLRPQWYNTIDYDSIDEFIALSTKQRKYQGQ